MRDYADLPLHDGKDGIPYPVDRSVYNDSIDSLEKPIRRAKVSHTGRDMMFSVLKRFFQTNNPEPSAVGV
ncbi:MAG: hypothetical protein A2Y33_12195 [Spirochaetes bacterium GWF1_51_8]|nr:MAG: hypothetical protein A2Y33_12195 [Spirochaetes bacterium GWF1_51_8]